MDCYSWENDENYSIYNLGVSGHTSEDILERIETEIEIRNNGEEMAVILRVTGVNDSQWNLETGKNLVSPEGYRENLEKTIEICRGFTGEVYLVGGTPVDEDKVDPMPWKQTHAYREKEIRRYAEKLRKVSDEKEVPLVEPISDTDSGDWIDNCLKDGVHPNEKGHRKIYSVVKRRLQKEGVVPAEL